MTDEKTAEPGSVRKIDSETQAAIHACIDHAGALLASARAVQAAGHSNIAFHLVTLALEEIGREKLIGIRAVARDSKESPPPWMEKHTQDHVKKLFWCFFGQASLSQPWTKERLLGMDALARNIHAKRLSGLYVDVGDDGLTIPAASITSEETEELIKVAEYQIRVASSAIFHEMTKEDAELQAWFLSAADDRETQRMIHSQGSLAKLAEFGDARQWMLWLKQQFQDAEAQAAEIMQAELARSKALPAVGTKEKWRMRVVILTNSHSLRPKEFAEWNRKIHWIKLSTDAKKNRLFLDLCLLDNVPAEGLWYFCWGMARHFVTALNIGSMGFWWWRMPEQVSRYYETLEDLETKSKMEIARSPPLTLNWGPTMRVLTNADLVRVMQCFAAMPQPEEREKQVPYGYYLAGVNFLSINDVHWQCEGIAFGNFLQALKAIMQQCGYWDGQTPFQDTLATYFGGSFSGAENSDHMMTCEFRRNPATDSDLKPATVPI
jgi:AbiV family abortive infection protein